MQFLEHLKFGADGLIPAIIYDAADNAPLTLCYMDREAVERTLATGLVHVFRRSKARVMLKGESSGHVQKVVEIAIDCEGNSLAIKVDQHVAACHAGYRSCYFRKYDPATGSLRVDDVKVFDPDDVYGR